MHVVAFNGSARKKGNTDQMLHTALAELEAEGITTEIIHMGGARLRGCSACMRCLKNQDRRCALDDDPMNEWIERLIAADGVLLGSPTYFANVTTEMKAFIDRAGFVTRTNGNLLRRKVGAPVVAVRRAGALQVYNALMAFFGISQMIIPSASYWNMGFGNKPREFENDAEGVETMKNLGQNMAWLLKKLA